MVVIRRAIAQGSGASVVAPFVAAPTKIDVPKPKTFKGTRNAKEIDNFFWRAIFSGILCSVDEDAKKIEVATLMDAAMVWWLRRHAEVEHGICTMSTWEEFKSGLKKPPEKEARTKFRRACRPCLREYVKEFSDVLLELPDKDALFFFMDGPVGKDGGAQDLATAISIAESLADYQRSSNGDKRDLKENGGGEGKSGSKVGSPQPQSPKSPKWQKEDKAAGIKRSVKCYVCSGEAQMIVR